MFITWITHLSLLRFLLIIVPIVIFGISIIILLLAQGEKEYSSEEKTKLKIGISGSIFSFIYGICSVCFIQINSEKLTTNSFEVSSTPEYIYVSVEGIQKQVYSEDITIDENESVEYIKMNYSLEDFDIYNMKLNISKEHADQLGIKVKQTIHIN